MVAVAGVADKHSESLSEACFGWKHLMKKTIEIGAYCHRCRRQPTLKFLVVDLKTSDRNYDVWNHCCFDDVRKNQSFLLRSAHRHQDDFWMSDSHPCHEKEHAANEYLGKHFHDSVDVQEEQ